MIFNRFFNASRPAAGRLPFLFSRVSGVGIGIYGAHMLHRSPVRCNVPSEVELNTASYGQPVQVRRSRLNGKLDYQQLSSGSFLGLLLGYITGKISKLLCFLTFTSLLTLQFLQSRGIINVTEVPLTTRITDYARDRFDARAFISNKPSFKISFFSSFIIAAAYA